MSRADAPARRTASVRNDASPGDDRTVCSCCLLVCLLAFAEAAHWAKRVWKEHVTMVTGGPEASGTTTALDEARPARVDAEPVVASFSSGAGASFVAHRREP